MNKEVFAELLQDVLNNLGDIKGINKAAAEDILKDESYVTIIRNARFDLSLIWLDENPELVFQTTYSNIHIDENFIKELMRIQAVKILLENTFKRSFREEDEKE